MTSAESLFSWIGALERNSRTGLMWNIALDGNGGPELPGTDSCSGRGCRALVTVNDDGSYVLNQECAFCLVNSLSTRPRYSDMSGSLFDGASIQGHHPKRSRWAIWETYWCLGWRFERMGSPCRGLCYIPGIER